jgi:RNA polymerase sigma factor (sigma-70 family)
LSQTPHIHQVLVERCREGDRRAQFELYQLYAKPMLNVSMRIVNDRFEAEDVLQECFVKAFSSLEKFRGDSSFGSWFKRIVVNGSINFVRKKKIQFDQIEDHQIAIEDEEYIEDITYTVQDIKDGMARLPNGYRVIFTLFMFEKMSHRDIADQMGITESTSKSQLNRAKKKLRTLIEEG